MCCGECGSKRVNEALNEHVRSSSSCLSREGSHEFGVLPHAASSFNMQIVRLCYHHAPRTRDKLVALFSLARYYLLPSQTQQGVYNDADDYAEHEHSWQ
jgi:hypothetical protein